MSGDESARDLRLFVNGSPNGLLQLLVAGAEKSTFKRIIACPRYPVPVRTRELDRVVRQFREVLARRDVHLPTFFAMLYASGTPFDRRKRSGQFFTAEAVGRWALGVARPGAGDHVWDAGSGTALFADCFVQSNVSVRSYTGIEIDPTLALCGAHVLDSIGAPSSFRVLYANFLSVKASMLEALGVPEPSFIISNPPYVRSQNLAGRSKIRLSLKANSGIELGPNAGSLSYFLLQAAALCCGLSMKKQSDPGVRLVFFLPREASGAAHARRLRKDLLNKQQWTWSEYTIPVKDTAVDRRSNALALCYVFERNALKEEGPVSSSKEEICLARVLRVRRGISTGCNEFFVLSDDQIRERRLPMTRFQKVLPTRVPVSGNSLSSSDWDLLRRSGHRCWLLTLPTGDMDQFEVPIREYLREGIRRGVHETPTAKALRAWYSIPVPSEPPDVLFTYLFRGTPRFTLNKAKVFHLTNILGGRFLSTISGIDRRERTE